MGKGHPGPTEGHEGAESSRFIGRNHKARAIRMQAKQPDAVYAPSDKRER
jgi:hypothetical protein